MRVLGLTVAVAMIVLAVESASAQQGYSYTDSNGYTHYQQGNPYQDQVGNGAGSGACGGAYQYSCNN
jgi:hypothetical protein